MSPHFSSSLAGQAHAAAREGTEAGDAPCIWAFFESHLCFGGREEALPLSLWPGSPLSRSGSEAPFPHAFDVCNLLDDTVLAEEGLSVWLLAWVTTCWCTSRLAHFLGLPGLLGWYYDVLLLRVASAASCNKRHRAKRASAAGEPEPESPSSTLGRFQSTGAGYGAQSLQEMRQRLLLQVFLLASLHHN